MNISHYFALMCGKVIVVEMGDEESSIFCGFLAAFPHRVFTTHRPSLNGGGECKLAAIVKEAFKGET